jgi:23S rRNA (uracil1939-C5)-methyltransferase
VTDTLLLSFVVRRDVRRLLKQLATDLRRTRHKISGIFMNLHEENNNKIFGDTEVHISGQKKLRENLCDLSFEISPTAFFQVNPWTAEIIYRRIEQLAGNTAHFLTAWDLFSGMGQIAMILARSGYQVCSIEENPAAVADAEQNFHLNELSGKVHALCGRTEEVQYQIPKAQLQPDLIVANPSRKGIPPATIDFIVNAMKSKKKAQFIYLSCDHQTLMRDLQLLVDQGMRLRQLEAFDMFPFTDKLEWIGVVTL